MDRNIVKFVIAGPVNAGKTTLIRTLSDVPVVCTNELPCDDVSEMKELTTVAMDHGIFYPRDNLELHLYGTPGQRRFDFMWEILAVGTQAIVFMVDASSPESISELKYIYEHFGERSSMPRFIIVNKADAAGAATAADIAALFVLPVDYVAVCDPRDRDAAEAVLFTFYELQASLMLEPA